MKKLIKITNNMPKTLSIFYDLGNTCNYKCHYCFPGSNEGTAPWPDAEIVMKNIVHIVNYYRSSGKINDVEIFFLGGEPTLWSKFSDVLKYVKENCDCRLCVLTNGSRTLRWWEENGQYFDNVGISVHHERADPEHIIKVSEILYKKGVFFYNAVLMDSLAWKKCVDIVNKLKTSKKNWLILAKPIHINGVLSYTERQSKYLRFNIKQWPSIGQVFRFLFKIPKRRFKAYFEDGSTKHVFNDAYFREHGYNNFKGWQCNLGVTYLWINRDGKITGTCQQKLYGLVEYFNMNDPDLPAKFSPEIKPVICEKTECHCNGEIALPKHRLS